MKQLFRFVRLFVVLAAGIAHPLTAQGQTNDVPTSFSLFDEGRIEGSFNNGALFSMPGKNRPTIDYTLSEIQCGYMLGTPKSSGFFRGNFEAIGQGFASAIFEGPGGYIAGMTLWIRYNFVQPESRLVPYLQFGAGMLSTDIDHEIVGQPFNFNLDVGAGTRFFVASKWAVNLEYRYQHISNANSGRKNIGVNAQGPMLGVSYFF